VLITRYLRDQHAHGLWNRPVCRKVGTQFSRQVAEMDSTESSLSDCEPTEYISDVNVEAYGSWRNMKLGIKSLYLSKKVFDGVFIARSFSVSEQ